MLLKNSALDLGRSNITRGNLRASMADGATFGAMVGLGETYLAAFALAVGLGEVSAGLISSVPLLAGGATQLISPWGVRWIGSEKRWILLAATIQGLAFFPLVWAAIHGSISLAMLLLIASVYWAGGLATGPAWNTWMESIVPRRVRPHYFAQRTRLSQIVTFAAFLAGGTLLQLASEYDRTLSAFALLFFLAGVFRLWSVSWLARHRSKIVPTRQRNPFAASPAKRLADSESRPSDFESRPSDFSAAPNRHEPKPSVTAAATRATNAPHLLAYLVVVQGMVQVCTPYCAPFMLNELGHSYAQYMGLLAIAFLAKVVALSWWARVAKRHSAHGLLWIGGIGIVPAAALWIVSQDYWWLAFAQLVGGIFWAAYELGFFLLFFEALPVNARTRMLTLYNFANSLAWFTGALVGGGLLMLMGTDRSAYLVLFAVSSLGRLAALPLLAGITGRGLSGWQIRVRILGIRPNAVSMDAPILTSMQQE